MPDDVIGAVRIPAAKPTARRFAAIWSRGAAAGDGEDGSPAARSPDPAAANGRGLGLAVHRYSRFVGRAKLALSVLAGALLLLLAAWPYLPAGMDRVGVSFPRLDAAAVRDLRMLHPRYSGIDREKRPFTVTAETALQTPASGLVALQAPRAQFQSQSGGWVIIAGDTGVYQPDAHRLDLFGHVTLFQNHGETFRTHSAHLHVADGAADGNEPVTGEGPSGTVTGEGFRVAKGGDIVVFTGRSHLTSNDAGPVK